MQRCRKIIEVKWDDFVNLNLILQNRLIPPSEKFMIPNANIMSFFQKKESLKE